MSVSAWQDELPLKTYMRGPDDPNPPWQRGGGQDIYPYPMQDDLTDTTWTVNFRALHLENEYLHAIILPELGGRLYSLYDKLAKREVFYRNNVVKYGLVARRGAWISGGIEFNFPKGHTCVTVSPVPAVMHEDPATGGAAVTVGCLDRVSRMRWAVTLSLQPGEYRLRQDVMLDNPTNIRRRHYFWSNSAVPATDDLHLVFPAVRARTGGGEREYPVSNGRDWSWYRNHERANDIFALDVTEDFFGCYYEESNVGMAHWSDHRLDVGKKFFTWGTADDGMIWVDLLTDEDGQYVELQAGRYVDQSTFEFLFPYQTVDWTEYWCPLHGLGGFVWSNQEGALNLAPGRGKAEVAAMVSACSGPGELTLAVQGKQVWQQSYDLAPGVPVRATAPLPPLRGSSPMTLTLTCGGREIIHYHHPPAYELRSRDATTRPVAPLGPPRTAEAFCVAAAKQEKLADLARAREYYEKALALDPDLSDAHLGLGLLDYRSGLYEDSRAHLRQAVTRNPENDQAWYYLALALVKLGRQTEAEAILWRLRGRSACRNEATIALARLAVMRSDAAEVFSLLPGTPASSTERLLAGIAGRLLSQQSEAPMARWLETLLEQEQPPASLLSATQASERYFAARAREADSAGAPMAHLRECLNDDPEEWLELVLAYWNLGRRQEALHLLAEGCRQVEGLARYPLAHYYWAAFSSDVAETQLQQAAAGDPAYCFPGRLEEIDILVNAAEQNPADWKARLYLGNLFAVLGRREEALRCWRTGAAVDDSDAVLCRNLGLAISQWEHDYETALGWYDKAVERQPEEYHLYLERDRLLEQADRPSRERLRAFTAAPEAVRERWECVARRVECLVKLEQWDEAIELMTKHNFRPWEGARRMHDLWTQALGGRAARRARAGELAGAIEDYRLALTYPRNLGVGQAAYPHEARIKWLLAGVYQQAGDTWTEREILEEVAQEPHEALGEADIYKLRALRELARHEEAAELAASLRRWADARLAANAEDQQARVVLQELGPH